MKNLNIVDALKITKVSHLYGKNSGCGTVGSCVWPFGEKKVASEIELKLSGKRGDGNELFKLPQVLQKGQILS